MRRQPAGVHLDLDDALVLEPLVRAGAGLLYSIELRRLADALAQLVADSRPSLVADMVTVEAEASTIDVQRLALASGCSPRTARRWAADGRVPARKRGGRWEIAT